MNRQTDAELQDTPDWASWPAVPERTDVHSRKRRIRNVLGREYCLLLATALAVLFLASACKTEGPVGRVNLSTWDPGTAGILDDATLGPATPDMSTGCVLLILENQKSVLPVWPLPTSWDPSSQAIKFVDVWGERTELREGDTIMPGGVTPIVEPEFVAPPSGSCEYEELFRLHALSKIP